MRSACLTFFSALVLVACGGGGGSHTTVKTDGGAGDMAMTSGAHNATCVDIAFECYFHGSCTTNADCTNGKCTNGICGGCTSDADCMGDSMTMAKCDSTSHRCAPIASECTSQDCITKCDAVGKNPQYGQDSEALWNCIDMQISQSGMGSPCDPQCGSSGNAQDCQACLFGTCMPGTPITCTGGKCSSQMATCYNDK